MLLQAPLTPNQRSLQARMAAHALHARTNGREHTQPARAAFLRRFEDQVDPDRTLPPNGDSDGPNTP